MKRKRVNFNTVQYVKRFDKTLPSNQMSEILTEPIMTIKKMQPITPPPSPVVKLTNDFKDMAIVKKSPPSKSKTKSPPLKKKSPTKTPTTPTKSSPAKTTAGRKAQPKKSPSSSSSSSKKSPTKVKRT